MARHLGIAMRGHLYHTDPLWPMDKRRIPDRKMSKRNGWLAHFGLWHNSARLSEVIA